MSNVSSVAAYGATVNSQTANSQSADGKDNYLSKDAFLQLLVTQLRYQDPLAPMDDKQFIAQMAQFTALEQTQNLNSQMQHLNALSMLGKTVTVQPTDGSDPITGVVERVVTENGVSKVCVDGQLYTTDQISAVRSEAGDDQSQQLNSELQRLNALSMLGKTVIVQPTDGSDPITGVVERVVTENGVSKLSVDGQLYTTDQVTAVE